MRTMKEIVEANKNAGKRFFVESVQAIVAGVYTDHVYDGGEAGTVFVQSSQIDGHPRHYTPYLSCPDGRVRPLMMSLESALSMDDGRRLAEIAARLLRAGASLVIVEDRLRAAVK